MVRDRSLQEMKNQASIASDEMMPAKKLPGWALPVMGFGILLAIGLGLLLILPRLPAFKNWRSDRLALEAEKAMDSGDWASAQNKVIAAYQLEPGLAPALRAAARLNAAAGLPEAIVFYRKLIASKGAVNEDYVNYADVLLRFGSYQLFQDIIGEASKRLPKDVRIQLLLSRYALVAGDGTAASRYLKEVLASLSLSQNQRAEAALLMISLPDAGDRRAGAESLCRIAMGDPKSARKLLAAVLGEKGTPDDVRERAAAMLKNLPGNSFEGRTESALSMIQVHPDRRKEILNDLTRDAKTPDERREVASLLVRLGENERALDFAPLIEARSRRDLFLIWLDAKSGLGQWDDVLNILRSGETPLEPALRDLYIARCYEALGQEGQAGAFFERAARTPTEDRELLFYLAGYFSQRDRIPMAVIVLDRLSRDAIASRSAFESLVNIYRSRGNTTKLAETLEAMAKRWPKDAAVLNDRNYLRLLQDRDIAQTLERCRVLASENPDLFPLKMTYALALLRANHAAEGLKVFQNSPVQLSQLLPQQKAIFAALLAANGKADAAASIVSTLNPEALLPAERKLLPSSP